MPNSSPKSFSKFVLTDAGGEIFAVPNIHRRAKERETLWPSQLLFSVMEGQRMWFEADAWENWEWKSNVYVSDFCIGGFVGP